MSSKRGGSAVRRNPSLDSADGLFGSVTGSRGSDGRMRNASKGEEGLDLLAHVESDRPRLRSSGGRGVPVKAGLGDGPGVAWEGEGGETDSDHSRHQDQSELSPRPRNRTFYGRDPGVDGETAPMGVAGTFRAKGLARRWVNSSRRHLLKQHQDFSTKSLISAASEATPLNLSIRVQTFSMESPREQAPESTEPADLEPKVVDIWANFRAIWFGKPVSLCMLVIPLALLAHHRNWSATWVFWLNFFVMLPLAAILGDFTEEAALHTNDTIGGLLNATFGNAVEVVVAIQALLANEIRVVQASMIGSIFSNLLLVLGMCFFCGGLYYKEQSFNSTSATASMALLALSSIAMVLPTPYAVYYDVQDDRVLTISRFAACFLLFMYLQLLVFQLYTHKHIFDAVDDATIRDDDEGEDGNGEKQDSKDDDEPRIPMWMALLGLGLTTAAITVFSDILVGSIDEFCKESGISRTFVGLIILPIVGNAVEHVTAVTVAMKNKMDLAMGVAVGSCTQISLFVVPLTVLVGWMTDKPMSLNFPHFEITLYVLSIFTVSICLANPRCNWLEGSLLCTTYLMIAVGFWFEEVVDF